MELFADYILNEQNLISKVEIAYYLSKKTDIYFNKSVIFKTEIVRQFIDYMKIDVDRNLTLTASLLCNCKKVDEAQKLGKLHTYALNGANYLSTLGFEKRFCKICEEVNRYSKSSPRERESDILELVDNFGGMLLDRPERIGLDVEEALVLLEHRNLKDKDNRYLEIFKEFVNQMEGIQVRAGGDLKQGALRRLVKIYNENNEITEFVKVLVFKYVPEVSIRIKQHRNEISKSMDLEEHNPNRSLFSEETTKKIMGHIDEANTIIGVNSVK